MTTTINDVEQNVLNYHSAANDMVPPLMVSKALRLAVETIAAYLGDPAAANTGERDADLLESLLKRLPDADREQVSAAVSGLIETIDIIQSNLPFSEVYTAIDSPDGSTLWNTPPADEIPDYRVWSIIETGGVLWAMPGFRVVDRLGWAVSAEPWEDGQEDLIWA